MVELTVVLALLIGVSLGMLGGGGSILAVPLLVYVAGLGPHQAVPTSLFVVGTTSLVAVLPHARAGRVRWQTGLAFGAAGMAGAYLGGRAATAVPGTVLLVVFAVMMLATAAAMLRGRQAVDAGAGTLRLFPVLGLGAVVGVVTGFVGAGGGFLIVPVLVLIGGLPISAAIGTSLLVISLQSAAGLAGHLSGGGIPWGLALAVTASAVIGSLLGARLAARVPAGALRRGFGWLVLGMAVLVLLQQVPPGIRQAPVVWPALGLAVLLPAGCWLAYRVRLRRRGRSEPAPAPDGEPVGTRGPV